MQWQTFGKIEITFEVHWVPSEHLALRKKTEKQNFSSVYQMVLLHMSKELQEREQLRNKWPVCKQNGEKHGEILEIWFLSDLKVSITSLSQLAEDKIERKNKYQIPTKIRLGEWIL